MTDNWAQQWADDLAGGDDLLDPFAESLVIAVALASLLVVLSTPFLL
jgi:ABC-type spermidine/putrescine transport system permease subunit II